MRQHNPEFFRPDIDIHKVKRVEFGILKPEEISKMSVVKVTERLVYGPNGEPMRNGLNDPAMGPSGVREECHTCKGSSNQCPGHFGHVELVKPMYHVGFIDKVVRVLSCVCYRCSKLRCDEGDEGFRFACSIKSAKKRFAAIYHICRNIKDCRQGEERKRGVRVGKDAGGFSHDGCGARQPLRYILLDKVTIQVEFEEEPESGGDRKRLMTPEEALNILKGISAQDCETMGFDPTRAKPEWMLIQNLPVPPPAVRPTITMDSTLKQDDDLTYQYRQVVRANQDLIRGGSRDRPSHATGETLHLLQFYLATLIDNELPGIPTSAHKSGKKIKALRARLRGKEGRLRQNLMGKRVDFSARSVITPDPSLSLDQLGVPRSIAMNMTIPEVVNPLNIDHLRRLVANGPYEWPGANYIIRDNRTRLSLRDPKKLTDVHLEYGYIVERHLMDEDFVIFNRQPSLHKMSMMGHRIKVLPYSSFRLNLSVTTPYNADFDGDEMNMHVPQSYETKAEIKEIMHVPRQIVSPQSNKPVMGLVQDTLMGMRLITSKDTFIEKDILMNLLMAIETFDGRIPVPAILKPKPLWTGKQLISLILPDVNLERLSASYDSQFKHDTPINAMDTRVFIQRGQLLMGGLCKKTVGSAAGGLVHIIWNDYSPDRCRRFLSTSQLVVNSWLVYHGFTVGIADTISDNETSDEIGNILNEAMKKVKQTMSDAQEGRLECQPGKNMLESFEAKINFDLNEARDSAGNKAMKSLSEANNVKMMVMAGSKGSSINISQIMSCVGQQNVEGKRIPFGFRNRTLPHFTKDDYGPESRGFVSNSYLSGLTPQEFYFHAMGGREGLIDTAVKTSETGYIQRRLIKSLEDVMVKYDGTVRNAMGYILQFLYGEDGMTGEYIEDQKISILGKSDKDMKTHYQMIDPNKDVMDELAKLKEVLDPSIVEQIADNMEMQVMLQKNFEEMVQYRNELRKDVFKPNDDKQHLPVNLERLIVIAKRKFNLDNTRVSDLNPCIVIEEIDKLLKRLIVVRGEDRVSLEAQSNGIKLFTIHLKTELAPKKLIYVDRLNKAAFDWLIGEVESRFNQAIVSPGEVVGAIAAQSIGEPATQMTLNTFHYAGVSSKNVTLGVPRLKEVINVAKTIKTPSMTIYLQSGISSNQSLTKKIQSQLEHTTLSQAANSVQILYDPNPKATIIAEDAYFLNLFYEMEDESAVEKVSPWVLRMELNRDKMTDKDLRMSEIQRKIREAYGNTLEVTASDDNADKLVIRIRTMKREEGTERPQDPYTSMNQLKVLQTNIMSELLIKGIPEIKKVYMREVKKLMYDDRGELVGDRKEWLLETDGVNLKQVLAYEGVDHTRTTSNNIIEIAEVLGIEAVRQAILRELRTVLNFYSIYVNYRHLAILADLMTHNGKLTSITRHGINRVDSAPLRRCSFEETVEILLEAAAFSEVDHIKGVTENIIIGQLCPLGTGCFDVMIDMEALKQARYISGPNEIAQMEGEQEIATPMQYSPSANTPFIGTPGVRGGMTPATPGTPYAAQDRSFSPSYVMSISSPNYPVSPAYLGATDLAQRPGVDKYSPASPPRIESSPVYQQVSSPGYSPEHSDAGGYSPSGYSPSSIGRVGIGMLSRARGGHLSPLYSPSGTFVVFNSTIESPSHPSYSPVGPGAVGSGPYSGSAASPRPGMQQYSPNSPSYNPNSPAYYVSSPRTIHHFTLSIAYNPSSPVYLASIVPTEQEDLPEHASPIREEEQTKEEKKE